MCNTWQSNSLAITSGSRLPLIARIASPMVGIGTTLSGDRLIAHAVEVNRMHTSYTDLLVMSRVLFPAGLPKLG